MTNGKAVSLRKALKTAGSILLWIIVVLLLLPTLVPPFLDRIYYRGPASDHFDGQRFSNPDGDTATAGPRSGPPLAMIARFMMGRDRAVWPERVPVVPGRPEPRVDAASGRMVATWIGHATVLVQAGGINILTDPIWSERAGPFGVTGPTRVRAPGVRLDDLPKIDLIVISHNHYDHMDLATLKRLWARDRPLIVTSLGNDTILKGAGVPAVTRDWGGRVSVRPGIDVVVERVHHWGSRWMRDRNRALWSGFTVTLPGGNLFFAGDTGFGDGSWPVAARKDGPYRLAIIPIGAFRPRAMMSPSHIGPVEAVEVFQRLGAANGMAMHWGTFQLSEEGINEPPALLRRTLAQRGIAPDRFRATEVGQPWAVPPLR
jgi:L-ascorbate metabolism protein UlaG (beta-lactamase superfamily)